MISGIYKIYNKLNNRFYIGSTKCFATRKLQHFNELKQNKHYNIFLQRDFNKSGEENFIFEIIELVAACELDTTKLLAREQHYLDIFYDKKKKCYNMNPMAAQPPSSKGRKQTEETKKKISISHMGEKNHMWGKETPQHVKEKLIKNSKPKTKVFSINIETGEKKIFDGIGVAARFYKIHRNSISDRVRGRSSGPINNLNFFKI